MQAEVAVTLQLCLLVPVANHYASTHCRDFDISLHASDYITFRQLLALAPKGAWISASGRISRRFASRQSVSEVIGRYDLLQPFVTDIDHFYDPSTFVEIFNGSKLTKRLVGQLPGDAMRALQSKGAVHLWSAIREIGIRPRFYCLQKGRVLQGADVRIVLASGRIATIAVFHDKVGELVLK